VEHLDGYVIEIVGKDYGCSVVQLGDTLRRALTALSNLDPSFEFCMSGNICKPNWGFAFNMNRFFVTSFAPCYDQRCSRYGFGATTSFILFQPEFSFSYHDVPPMAEQNTIRHKIRKAFDKSGRPYKVFRLMVQEYLKTNLLDEELPEWWLPGEQKTETKADAITAINAGEIKVVDTKESANVAINGEADTKTAVMMQAS